MPTVTVMESGSILHADDDAGEKGTRLVALPSDVPKAQREDDAKKGRDSKLDTAVDSLDSPSWHAEPSKSSELEEGPGYRPDPEFLGPTSKRTLHAIDPLVRMLEPRTHPPVQPQLDRHGDGGRRDGRVPASVPRLVSDPVDPAVPRLRALRAEPERVVAHAVAVGAGGIVYVTGESHGGGYRDFATIEYAAT
jgi:hypothetical protein